MRRNPQQGNLGCAGFAEADSYCTLVQLEWQSDFWEEMGMMPSPALWFLWACLTTGTWLKVYRHLLILSLLERWRLEDAWKWGVGVSELLLNIFQHTKHFQHRETTHIDGSWEEPSQQCSFHKSRQQTL